MIKKNLSRQSDKFLRKERVRGRWTAALAVIAASSWLFSVIEFTKLPQLTIENVEIIGADRDIESGLRAAALESIQGRYLGLFEKSNIFTYPKRAVGQAVMGNSARIAGVKISRIGAHTLVADVAEKMPVAVVCADLPNWQDSELAADHSGQCYRADKDGFLFMKEPAAGDDLDRYYIPGLNDESGESDLTGKYAASTTDFVKLRKFYDGAKINGIAVRAVLVKGGDEYEMYVDDSAANDRESGATIVYFNGRNGFDNQLANLVSFWNREMRGGSTNRFDSIDLRYGANVFFRPAHDTMRPQ